METKNTNELFSVIKGSIIVTVVLALLAVVILFGAYTSDKNAYIEANTSNTGIVTDKSYKTSENHQPKKYTVTVERQITNTTDETQTKTETYTITYSEWLQIEEGHVAVYNKDGSIDILPPSDVNPNTENTGTVTDKSPETDSDQLVTRYTVTVQRYALDSAGKATTKTETYTVSYEDWTQIENGYIATYNADGSVDIDPPKDGAPAPDLQTPEPYDTTFREFVEQKYNEIKEEVSTFLEDETNRIYVLAALAVIVVLFVFLHQNREAIDAKTKEFLDKHLQPYSDKADDDVDYEDEEETEDEEGEDAFDCDEEENDEPPIKASVMWHEITGMAQRHSAFLEELHSTQDPDNATSILGQVPSTNKTISSNPQESSLTVHQIRDLIDNLTQIEITEGYVTRASGYNNSLTTEYDDRPVTKLSISSSFSPKVVLDITQKTF